MKDAEKCGESKKAFSVSNTPHCGLKHPKCLVKDKGAYLFITKKENNYYIEIRYATK